MYFQRLNATFGKLHQRTLTLQKGLNIIEAPNESGKSTFAAFLKDMFYGVSTSRGKAAAHADRARFTPWSGEAMEGSIEIADTGYGDITLTRRTKRAAAPFADLSVTYSGSGEAVSAIAADNCGERLLGIPQAVFERSAFIHQNALAVESDTDLEKRITSLITSGEEDTSFTDAETALRTARNARRSSVSRGAIPAAERELYDLQEKRDALASLLERKQSYTQEIEKIDKREAEIRLLLSRHADADVQEQCDQLLRAEAEQNAAKAALDEIQRAVQALPTEEAAAQAQVYSDTLVSAMRERDAVRADVQAASAQLGQFDLQHTGEKVAFGRCLALLAPLTYIIISGVWFCIGGFSLLCLLAPLGAALLFSVPASYLICKAKRDKLHAEKRRALEADLQSKQSMLAAQESTCRTQEQSILSLLRVCDMDEARRVMQAARSKHSALREAQYAAEGAAARCDALRRQFGALTAPAKPVTRPAESVAALQSEAAALAQKRVEMQSTVDQAEGRGLAIGDIADLDSEIAQKQEALARLHEEYNAIDLAISVLTAANTELQNRFSPSLSKRAAELFAFLSDGKYDRVLLDRKMNASAGEVGAPAAHDASFLSRGAYDQLYFAVRLAICEAVLPQDCSIPLVLDDALTSFDDARMKKALDLLLQESEHRQILLFTCQHREAEYLSGKPHVSITNF